MTDLVSTDGIQKNSKMKRTLRLSVEGRSQIEHARHSQGWTTKDERWLKAAHEFANPEPPNGWIAFWKLNPDNFSPSESTLRNKFLKQQNIRQESFIALCQAVGLEWEDVVDRDNPAEGQPPQVTPFYGRMSAISQLQTWVLDKSNCRSILLYGRAGIGKTAIAYRLIQTSAITQNFRSQIWLSLESAMPLAELVDRLIGYLSAGQVKQGNLADLIQYLKQDRYLIILDQWETILDSTSPDGYRTGYENYQDLLKYIGQKHQSCILIISREKLQFSILDRIGTMVKTLKIGGLTYPEDRDFLKAEGLIGTDLELQQFIERYENPSILKLIADRVRTIHGGRVAPLVAENVSVYTNHDTVKIIDAEFRHLGKLEQSIVYWLAIWRNPLSYQQLQDSFRQDLSVATLDEALYSLINQRSLVKTNPQLEYYLEPVTLKEITNLFVRKNVKELSAFIEGQDACFPQLLISHALTIGDDSEIRRAQMRRIVRSIIEQLLTKFQSQILWQRLTQIQSHGCQGYAADNLVILLREIDK